MTKENPLDPIRQAREEEYFNKRNRELSRQLRARLELKGAGIDDDGLIQQLTSAGFDAETLKALFFVPMIEVAWADNRLEKAEADEVLRLTEERGIAKNSKAYRMIESWLEKNPTADPVFNRSQQLLEPILSEAKKTDP